MRIFTASLATETNTFSPIPTSRQSYEETLYFPPGKHPDRGTLCTGPLWVARRLGIADAKLPHRSARTAVLRHEYSHLAGKGDSLDETANGQSRIVLWCARPAG